MKVFVATMEGSMAIWKKYPDLKIEYGLCSMKAITQDNWRAVCRHVDNILVDSGAHSFQHAEKVEKLDGFIEKYISFIKQNARSNKIWGFFELDIDNKIGVEAVAEIRKDLNKVSDRIIPVWHQERGIDEYYRMLEEYKGRRVAVSGFADEIYPNQYNLFINAAHKYNCNIHLLGCTRWSLIQTLNLARDDSVDSSTWRQGAVYGTPFLPSSKYSLKRVYGICEGYRTSTVAEVNLLTTLYLQSNYKEKSNV